MESIDWARMTTQANNNNVAIIIFTHKEDIPPTNYRNCIGKQIPYLIGQFDDN
jgi:hypothetical protein